uniref:Uncharacterized protein n=1 Tax=Anguilla anguilla TaxID=7936 RepID=A0A0E9VSS2_ANGAN
MDWGEGMGVVVCSRDSLEQICASGGTK